VADHPPHLHHYGILFGHTDTALQPWMRSWQTMAEAAREILDHPPNRLSFFYVGGTQQSLASYRAFLDDVATHQLAGLLVPGLPIPHFDDLVTESGGRLPIVAYHMGGPPEGPFAQFRFNRDYTHAMIEHLAARGRRKVALIASRLWFRRAGEDEAWQELVTGYGMRSESRWCQIEAPDTPAAVRNVAELLASDPNGPDALIIQDTTLLHQVSLFEGMSDQGYVLINSRRSTSELGLDEFFDAHPAIQVVTVPASRLAQEHVGRPLPNAALLGGFAALTGIIQIDSVARAIGEKFSGNVARGNIAAARAAYDSLLTTQGARTAC